MGAGRGTRRAYLGASLRALDASLRQRTRPCPSYAATRCARSSWPRGRSARAGCTSPPTTAPYGHRRDLEVEQALADAGIELVRTGSPYAVAPDRVRNQSGNPYKVYTPFSKGWLEHGWRDPVDAPTGAHWLALDETVDVPDPELPAGLELPEAGEAAPAGGGRRTSRSTWPTTTTSGTAPTWTPPAGCRGT